LYAAPTSLYPRLDVRIDEMIEVFHPTRRTEYSTSYLTQKGLLEEVRTLRGLSMQMVSGRQDYVDETYTLGLYQSIGNCSLLA